MECYLKLSSLKASSRIFPTSYLACCERRALTCQNNIHALLEMQEHLRHFLIYSHGWPSELTFVWDDIDQVCVTCDKRHKEWEGCDESVEMLFHCHHHRGPPDASPLSLIDIFSHQPHSCVMKPTLKLEKPCGSRCHWQEGGGRTHPQPTAEPVHITALPSARSCEGAEGEMTQLFWPWWLKE